MTSGADDGTGRSGRDRPGRPRPDVGTGPDEQPRHNGHRPQLRTPPLGTDTDAGPDEPDEPIWKKHRPPFFAQPRVVLGLLIVLLVVGAVVINRRQPTWPPKAQCDHPAIAVSRDHAKHGFPVYWAATGPAARYAVTVGAKSVRLAHGKIVITGTESMAGSHATVLRQHLKLTGCRAVHHFKMPMPPGEYHLRLYRLHGGTATQVAKARVDSNG